MVDCESNLNKCNAACCRLIVIRLKVINDDQKRYYKLHGCEIKQRPDRTWDVLLPVKCSALGEDNLCTIQDNKPLMCKRFDENSIGNYYVPDDCLIKKTGGLK